MTTDTLVKTDVETITKAKVNVQPPKQYNVVYVNDDVTTFEFVVDTLMGIFGHTYQSAEDLTVKVHEEGSAIVAVLPYEVAEQKATEVILLARRSKLPLQVRVEPAE